MQSRELKQEEQMSYAELTSYLLKKYGPARYDYFLDDVSWIKSQYVSRTKDGLFCHHIDEDVIPTLSDPDIARKHSFVHQKADHLVYGNYLEHLLLHMKIGFNRFRQEHDACDDPALFPLFATHGVRMITREINTLIMENGSESPWQERCFDAIRKALPDYPELLVDFQTGIISLYERSAAWNEQAEDAMEKVRDILSDSENGTFFDLREEIHVPKEYV